MSTINKLIIIIMIIIITTMTIIIIMIIIISRDQEILRIVSSHGERDPL